MKILYYNWIPFDDDENRGGGVTVYQKNLISKLVERENYDIYFVSSGVAYDNSSKTKIRKTRNIFGKKCHSFIIVNSPMLSPGHLAFDDIETYLNDLTLYDALKHFIEQYGPFDVIHFNNYEGLSLNVLKLKEIYPNTKFVYSLHNYYSFCPQVNLWKKEKENCLDFHDGKDCLSCLKWKANREDVMFANRMAYSLKKKGFNSKSIVFKAAFKYFNKLQMADRYKKIILKKPYIVQQKYTICSSNYLQYRKKNVEYINKYVDVVLCVSNRVREIAIKMGVNSQKAYVDYIGTLVADNQKKCSIANCNSNIFAIAFMGYMRRDKGFYFFLKALDAVDDNIAKNISIIVAAKLTDKKAIKKIYKLGKKFHRIELRDGYKHNELPDILKDVHLGIIPVMWEDNLPQVAIEMIAQGVPILTSDLGGAHELCSSSNFVFENNNVQSFLDKIYYFYNNRSQLTEFWNNKNTLTTFEQHINNLERYYK